MIYVAVIICCISDPFPTIFNNSAWLSIGSIHEWSPQNWADLISADGTSPSHLDVTCCAHRPHIGAVTSCQGGAASSKNAITEAVRSGDDRRQTQMGFQQLVQQCFKSFSDSFAAQLMNDEFSATSWCVMIAVRTAAGERPNLVRVRCVRQQRLVNDVKFPGSWTSPFGKRFLHLGMGPNFAPQNVVVYSVCLGVTKNAQHLWSVVRRVFGYTWTRWEKPATRFFHNESNRFFSCGSHDIYTIFR